jgi:hypothetical protein
MDVEIPEQFTEAYQLIHSIDLQHERQGFRIEIARALRGERAFWARYYSRGEDGAWRRMTGPGYVSAASADLASSQALGFLLQHVKQRIQPPGG